MDGPLDVTICYVVQLNLLDKELRQVDFLSSFSNFG